MTYTRSTIGIGALALGLACAAPASAHITFETPSAVVGGSYKAVLRVPHGCKGSDTTRIRVRMPDGAVAAKPQPKPGWTLDLVQGDYAKPETLHGATITSGVREISWSGRLPDAYYDEFVFRVSLASSLKAGDTLYFPVVQECAQGVERWIDTSGKDGADGPAPGIELLAPAKADAHGHSH
ncbi:YcnI family copper-binding membrane protein [Castellaniella sp. S9]|uniref:YcnI family copper-binding membrane protein n=1 Tax=Castellaniella sp. S9 TaxID=2993652 RepID=UPI0022B37941|nr:YcnI family protein [Castellaniella sp. S9]